MMMFGNS